ncbi:hypothetical protein WH96_18350 [Kiloniella spongiae]|uniref:Uncharacterized protein n=1 Tax=Kiloniella spongiae TaxID=1489064 RepID=A0A0H2MEV9_9PROT|nr:hypothetical protein [Kiloniella spongiae]KLN59277.1 hypothetical protein WH96_18350 [Kiloniella spongiae]
MKHFTSPALIASSTLFLGSILILPANAAAPNPYPTQVKEVLTKYNVDQSSIKSQTTLERGTSNDRRQRIEGYDTFIRFHNCKGYLKIAQHRFGHVKQIFTRGECKVPGIDSF